MQSSILHPCSSRPHTSAAFCTSHLSPQCYTPAAPLYSHTPAASGWRSGKFEQSSQRHVGTVGGLSANTIPASIPPAAAALRTGRHVCVKHTSCWGPTYNTHTHIQIPKLTHTHIHKCIHTHTYNVMYVYSCLYIHPCMYTFTHHTLTDAHTYTASAQFPSPQPTGPRKVPRSWQVGQGRSQVWGKGYVSRLGDRTWDRVPKLAATRPSAGQRGRDGQRMRQGMELGPPLAYCWKLPGAAWAEQLYPVAPLLCS